MNAERLHSLAKSLVRDLKSTKALDTLGALRDSLQQSVSQPNQGQHQQNVSSNLENLGEALRKSATNEFSPALVEAAKEVGAWEITGQRLIDRLSAIFAANQITPSVALDQIKDLHKQLENLNGHLTKITEGMSGIGLDAETLEPGHAELGVLVPRLAVSNELGPFATELQRINRTLGVFSEVATGSRDGFQLRTVSSSDLTVFVEALPQIAACVALAVERTVALYKSLLEIRRLKQEIAAQGVGDDALAPIEAHAEKHMEEGIGPIVAELMERFWDSDDQGRTNEIRTDLRFALNQIANRLDRGFHFEVRVRPIAAKSEEDSDVDPEVSEAIETILRAQPGLEFLKADGNPILQLPEPDSDEEANG